MSQIQISLEGISAVALAEALQGLPGFDVSYQVADSSDPVRGERLDRVLVTLTTIVGLASGTIGLADDAVSLAEHVRNFQSPPVQSVVIQSDRGNRVTLENATPEQIIEVVKSME
jgi:hypothetical protein